MHPSSMKAMQYFLDKYLDKDKQLSIIDIGSKTFHEQENYKSLMTKNWQYVGVDIEAGENVDLVLKDPYNWTEIKDESYDVVISGQCAEHVEDIYAWFKEVSRILKKGGHLAIIVPFAFPEHKYPLDCWRIMPDGFNFLFNKICKIETKEIKKFWHVEPVKGDCLGIGQKPIIVQKEVMETSLQNPIKYLLNVIQEETFKSTYFGIRSIKSPTDFWIYQEIIYRNKPTVIIELGNFHGGSLLAYAHILQNIQPAKIIGVDINHSRISEIVKKHPSITLIEGDAVKSFEKVKSLIKPTDRVMIIEDSSHTYDNTISIMNTYQNLVSIGQYFIIEDSICHHGLELGPEKGPYEAIKDFMEKNDSFKVDRSMERFLITWNPTGYLLKIK